MGEVFRHDIRATGIDFDTPARTGEPATGRVLIFVTPSAPVTFRSQPWARPKAVERIVSLWDSVIDPATNGTDVAARLARVHLFSRMQPGDAPLAWASPSAQMQSLVLDFIGLPH